MYNKRPREIKNIVDAVLQKIGNIDKRTQQEIILSWPEVVGRPVNEHTKPQWFDKGRLMVTVDSSVWLNELNRYAKQQIIEKINQKIGKNKIRTILFQIGEIT